nr:helix-turn-helix transcriptional regulator [uncultured Holophaga sp.]
MTVTIHLLDDPRIREILLSPPKPHRHGVQEIVLLTQGGGEHRIDGELHAVEAPVAVIIARGKQHCLLPRPDTRGWVINFSEEALPAQGAWLFSQFFSATHVSLGASAPPDLVFGMATLLSGILATQGANGEVAAAHQLQAMILLLQTAFQQEVTHQGAISCEDFRLFVRFLEVVEVHYQAEKHAAFYARQLGVPVRRILRLARSFLGRTFKQVIEDRAVAEARRMLHLGDAPIKAIVADLGYQDPSYFTKVFRRATGLTPLAFRRQGQLR